MKKRLFCLAMALTMILCGCSWMDGSYVSVTPHREQLSAAQTDTLSADSFAQLQQRMTELTEAGTPSAVIIVSDYDQTQIEKDMEKVVQYVSTMLPIGAYAIEGINYEIGVSAGQPAVSVNITYLHGRSELRKIREAADMEEASSFIQEALDDCASNLILYVENYADLDLEQLVEDYAAANPDLVMEVPQLSVGYYPESGISRVVEMKFTYQTSRDSLRSMQSQVRRVFASAALYVDQEAADDQKYTQLFSFLSDRFPYHYETSITPAYSLLCHGVGDSRAFAVIYATMCRKAGVECQVVSGTKNGEAWFWNLICEEGTYYHVDLLESRSAGQFTKRTDERMNGYVWDFSAYPAGGETGVAPTGNAE